MNKEKDTVTRRTRLACVRCRERKKKCDGGKPICQSCIDNGVVNCKYLYNQDKRRPYTNNYVDSLKKHIKILESKLQKFESLPTSAITGSKSVGKENDNDAECSMVNNINELLDYSGKIKASDGNSYRYYGPRSTVSFVINDTPLINTRPLIKSNEIIELFELGSNPEFENHLYNLYFAYQNCTLVLIWREKFFQQLNLPKNERNPNFLTTSLQNVMLAIGTIFNSNIEKEKKFYIANQYAIRSRTFLDKEISNPLISTVQTCGLLSIFYVYLNEDSLSSYFSGAAISIAYSLGLNIGDQVVLNSEFFSDDEIELRRITFWAMYLLERTLNNMLGRPVLLKPESIISMVPSETGIPDYEQWLSPYNNNNNNKNVESQSLKNYTRCFSLITYSIELWIITSKPLDHIYLCFKPSIPSELEFIVNKANIELLQFENTFPEYLTFSYVVTYQNRETISPGIFLFQMKFQYIKILLHRVFFIRKFELPQQFDEEEILLHKKVCYESAMNIGKLASIYGKSFGYKNFEFSTPDMICTAAIILLFFIRYPKITSDQNSNKENESQVRNSSLNMYNHLKNGLVHIAESNLWAKRSLCVLKQLITDWGLSDII
ncbi:hypothetical protein C6P40_004174 [Pichia californica]|uniref:Zn(2)-C6 fungal-type domain-containing protein n=1 Tax=Pichia californica TaxID=460514 RepID=A0A9P6WMM2_9ASCO|nr:hypothetical protein C6P40_004174 [[Candida] californica]